jgi:DNA invertase Pin-like site-specific DNA recombinase
MERMKYGYARVSTDDQNPALRREDVAALLSVDRTTLYRTLAS